MRIPLSLTWDVLGYVLGSVHRCPIVWILQVSTPSHLQRMLRHHLSSISTPTFLLSLTQNCLKSKHGGIEIKEGRGPTNAPLSCLTFSQSPPTICTKLQSNLDASAVQIWTEIRAPPPHAAYTAQSLLNVAASSDLFLRQVFCIKNPPLSSHYNSACGIERLPLIKLARRFWQYRASPGKIHATFGPN